jgi:hypothetical protein
MDWKIIALIALALFLGWAIGDFEGVSRGWLHALKHPPQKQFEIKPIVYFHPPTGSLSIRLVHGMPDDKPITGEWPQYFLYEPPPVKETTVDYLAFGPIEQDQRDDLPAGIDLAFWLSNEARKFLNAGRPPLTIDVVADHLKDKWRRPVTRVEAEQFLADARKARAVKYRVFQSFCEGKKLDDRTVDNWIQSIPVTQ